MVSTILGRKLGMTQIWDENDNVVPVTVIQAGPCTVSQVKTKATDGYDAVQIGFGDISAKHVNQSPWPATSPSRRRAHALPARGPRRERRGAQGPATS